MDSDLSSMERGGLCRDRCMGLLLAEYMRDRGAARPNANTLCAGSVLKRLSHNSKSQQKGLVTSETGTMLSRVGGSGVNRMHRGFCEVLHDEIHKKSVNRI
jgi:hypothetical protein